MSLIDKAGRLRDISKRSDTLSEHRCRSFQPVAAQIFTGRTPEKALEHAGKMDRMNPGIRCDLGNGNIRIVAGEYHLDRTAEPARRMVRLSRLVRRERQHKAMKLQGAGFQPERRRRIDLVRNVMGKSIRIGIAQAERRSLGTCPA
ncbi:hypothetical protein ASF09_04340 [Sphingomonas sp. Leaf242]|nr:hypothetical protein [Sphingomonas sp. Leaf242]KQO08941.1 hypothetical protein ASF09_04340 [Sphingomonas sp. Leaf242]